jgi:hypothetical protein
MTEQMTRTATARTRLHMFLQYPQRRLLCCCVLVSAELAALVAARMVGVRLVNGAGASGRRENG